MDKMELTDKTAQALSNIESTAALLLLVANNEESLLMNGLCELLYAHAHMLYEAHNALAACFMDHVEE